MLRNNYSEVLKRKFRREFFFWTPRKNFRRIGRRSNLVVDDPRRLSPILGLVDLEVREESGRLPLQQLEHGHCATTDLQLGTFTRAKLQHRSPCSRVGGDDDFRLGGGRQNYSRRLSRHFSTVDLVTHPPITLHEVLDEPNVAFLSFLDLLTPLLLERVVSDNRRRDDEVRLGLIDVALTELAIGEAGAMTNQFVR